MDNWQRKTIPHSVNVKIVLDWQIAILWLKHALENCKAKYFALTLGWPYMSSENKSDG